jgi:hypothetical protein
MTSRPRDSDAPAGSGDPHADDFYEEAPTASGGYDVDHCDAPVRTHARVTDDQAEVLVEGRAPQGEQDARETCLRLARALSARDRKAWRLDDSRALPPYVDGYVCNEAEGPLVPVQVTRVGSSMRWERLNTTGTVLGAIRHAEAAEEIWMAIRRKRQGEDASTILALRGQPGVHTVQCVVDEFLRTYGSDLQFVLYREIWLIGSSPETHCCLRPV